MEVVGNKGPLGWVRGARQSSARRSGARKRLTVAAALVAGVGLLAACTIDRAGSSDPKNMAVEQGAPEEAAPLAPAASVADGAKDVDPTQMVTVKAVDGDLASVEMTNQNGKVVKAEMDADKKSWTTTEVLGYGKTYTLTASSTEGATKTTTFSTPSPQVTSAVYLSPIPDSTVGIGQVISFRFQYAVEDRHMAQDNIEITTEPHVDGQFFWLNNRELRWRPKDFWEPGTQVSVKANIYGKKLGEGHWGGDDQSTNFTIGDAVITTADDNTKTITVTRNGEVVKEMPTSMGSAQFPTPNGTYVVGDRNEDIVMDSSTFGLPIDDPNGYRTNVQYATQMSWSGIYIHAAPWSVWAQGKQNTSHGCLNVSTPNAKWFLDNAKRGDVVVVKNTQGGTLSGYDGLGDWNIPWDVWGKGNVDETSAW